MDPILQSYPQAADQVRSAREVCEFLWQRGWSERNGGNISVNLTGLMPDTPTDDATFVSDARIAASKARGVYFVTGTGCRLRDVASSKPGQAAIVALDPDKGGYWILDSQSLEGVNYAPTSEFISHLMIHAMRTETNSGHRALVHSHPIELLCITHNPALIQDADELNRLLWSTLPEVRVFIPQGVTLVPYALPGGEPLARATTAALQHADVALWEKHGALATGSDAHEAFDFVDVANKGAIIVLKCLAAGFTPEGMSNEAMKELEETYLS